MLYGGVSLAVYINGVTQELFSLVRATAPDLADDSALHHRDDELTETERVYRQLGRLHEEPDATADSPVRTRFVVDIISGSSAGGINGIYLGKALANQQQFSTLRSLWIEKGDVGQLLNDNKARKPRRDRLPDKEPVEALFSGDVMYLELLDALDSMDRPVPGQGPTNAPASPYVNDLDVWVTATDLEGTALPLHLADANVPEKSHRHSFHFVFGEAQADEGLHNDFAVSNNPILAFAARATSSFPFAFAPARLSDIKRVERVQGTTTARCDPLLDTWKPWFANQRQVEDFDYENVSFGDGGDMDNKPFGWVIDTLPLRTSSTPVDRRLLYVEPDPGEPATTTSESAPRPDVIGSTIAAVMLGRVEAIRDDIQRLARVSEVRERIGAVTATIDARYADDHASSEALVSTTQDWLTEGPEAMKDRGLAYAAYYRLRIDVLEGEYGRSLVGLPWHAAETPESAAMRALVAHWVAETYADPYTPRTPGSPTTKDFLRDYDIAYRIRRLMFVAAEADRLWRSVSAPPTADPDEWVLAFRKEARRIKGVLAGAEQRLRMWVPSIRSNPDAKPDDFVLSSDEVQSIFGRAGVVGRVDVVPSVARIPGRCRRDRRVPA